MLSLRSMTIVVRFVAFSSRVGVQRTIATMVEEGKDAAVVVHIEVALKPLKARFNITNTIVSWLKANYTLLSLSQRIQHFDNAPFASSVNHMDVAEIHSRNDEECVVAVLLESLCVLHIYTLRETKLVDDVEEEHCFSQSIDLPSVSLDGLWEK